MNAGDLKWFATIQAEQQGISATGAPIGSWKNVGRRRCSVAEISGTKADQGSAKQNLIAWYTVVMRYSPSLDIQASYQLTIKGAPFDGLVMRVSAVRHDGDKTQVSLTCVVEE